MPLPLAVSETRSVFLYKRGVVDCAWAVPDSNVAADRAAAKSGLFGFIIVSYFLESGCSADVADRFAKNRSLFDEDNIQKSRFTVISASLRSK